MLCRRVIGCLHFYLSCLFVCLLVCFPSIFPWMERVVFFHAVPRGSVVWKPTESSALSSPPLCCCFSLAIYSFHCLGRRISRPPTPPPRSHTCLSLSYSHFFSLRHLATSVLFISSAQNMQGESEQRMKTKHIHGRRSTIPPVRLPPDVTPVD